ncbi:MAG: gliding motility-associated C-terminal domain-containing protein [Bacteroidales bacterium]|nr:gliding motility-associated C-terminal domain-containing protein [Bacteroidales bacterium]
MHKHILFLVAALLLSLNMAQAQSTFTEWGPSDPSPVLNCGEYQWPEGVMEPCPEVQVKQKHDHTPLQRYQLYHFDTVVTNCISEITLTCTPYIPVQFFNGQYTVDQIPYAPADTTFHSGSQIPNSADDQFSAVTNLPSDFPFFFFGKKYTAFVTGGNGIITFNTAAAQQGCAYGIYNPLPWTGTSSFGTNGGQGISDGVVRHRNAIYGVLQDTDPSCNTTSPQGIWYNVIDEFPCRKIIASFNDLPWFSCSSNANNRQKYQIICYEGSNIIEVHISRRTVSNSSSSWCFNGVIGVQNETGEGQVRTAPGTPTWNVHAGAHAAYYPASTNFGNVGTTTITNTAYRFTPQGDVLKNYGWYRIVSNGVNDTLGNEDNGIDSYWEVMQGDNQDLYTNWNDAPCPSLTKLHVRIDEPTKFVFFLRFHNALDTIYNLADTVYVGVDRGHDINLHAVGRPATERTHSICAGQTANLVVEWPALQDTAHTSWNIWRILNGDTIQLQNSLIHITRGNLVDSTIRMPVTLNSAALPAIGVNNKIDSIYLLINADFANCTDSNSKLLIQVYPNFDTTIVKGICEGQRYYWTADSAYHAENTDPNTTFVQLHSEPGCDSTVRLALTVYGRTHYTDHVFDCEPYTWINDTTYYETNTATALQDTIVLQNQWGCDSVVHLDFQLQPVTAIIRTNVDHFTLSSLDVTLTDASTGSNARTWVFPDGGMQTEATAYYTMPAELDSAEIFLIAHSAYGDCYDTTNVVIPLQRENIWIPNAFTPDNNVGNNLFGSISKNTLSEEMMIFNRHGELVYKCDKVDCTWDGKDLNGNACPQGTYVYIIRYVSTFEPDREHLLKGTVTLIR